MGLGLCGTGGDRSLADKGVCVEAAGKNCGLFCREDNLKTLYRCIPEGYSYGGTNNMAPHRQRGREGER